MMLPNLRFSLRYLVRARFFTTLHVVGLTLGIGVTMVILLFIRYELSFDQWNSKVERIYRINSSWKQSNQVYDMYATPVPLADVVRNELPEVETVAMVFPQFKSTVAITPERIFSQEHILLAEAAFVDIFDIEILSGDKQALRRPYQALISQSTTQKFFGNEDPLGRSFKYRGKFDVNVAGVFKDLPDNTSLPASILISHLDGKENKDLMGNSDTWYFGGAKWTTLNAITFALLDPEADPSAIEAKLDNIAEVNINKVKESEAITCSFSLQPLSEIHLDASRFGGGQWVPAMDPKWLLIFGGIGFAVLFLACVNFVNLSTAQLIVRAKEAGIRKTVGAGRRQLIFQFLTEPVILAFISGVLAIAIALWMSDIVNQAFGRHVDVSMLTAPASIAGVFVLLMLVGLTAGLYPAWLITRTNPATSLKPGIQSRGNAAMSWLRKTLVVFQFGISAVLMIIVFVISQQVRFMHSKDLGFRKDGVMMINLPEKEHMQAFVDKVKSIPGVLETSLSRSSPISDDHWWNTMGKAGSPEVESVCLINCDRDFFELYNLRLLSGRIPHSPNTINEVHQVVVNEKLLSSLSLGTPEQAVGKRFSWAGQAEVAGVVADFNSLPLHYGIYPLLFYQDPAVFSHANIRLENVQDQTTLSNIESIWKSMFPSEPYEPKILTDQITSYYKTESSTYTMFLIFAGVAVLISCLGLLGLCVFANVRRTKEISIRKVLGASVESILLLLSGQFMKITAIACVVALPIAWFSIDFLLGFYAYRIDITWQLFLVPMIILLIIAFVTMLTQTLQASVANPVKNLRSE